MGRHISDYTGNRDMSATDKVEVLAAIRGVSEQQWDIARGQAEIRQELGEVKGKVAAYGRPQLLIAVLAIIVAGGAWLFPRNNAPVVNVNVPAQAQHVSER
jgi:hypothetical protein